VRAVAEKRRNTEHARGAKHRGHEELRERKIPRCARNDNFVEVRRWELAGRAVGDFTEDGGAAGAGGGGDVGGAVVEGFVGEEGEGVGFFGLFGDVEVGGGDYFDGMFWEVPSGK